jgi:arylsulfatase A-like enzyme
MLQPPGFGTKPHLITIIMDDFGWNSVGFHGHNPEIQTPTMDALALSGLRLDTVRRQHICALASIRLTAALAILFGSRDPNASAHLNDV